MIASSIGRLVRLLALIVAGLLVLQIVSGFADLWGPRILGAINPSESPATDPGLPIPTHGKPLAIEQLLAALKAQLPGFEPRLMEFAPADGEAWTAVLFRSEHNTSIHVAFDPHSGKIVTSFSKDQIRFIWLYYVIHTLQLVHGKVYGTGNLVGWLVIAFICIWFVGGLYWRSVRPKSWRRIIFGTISSVALAILAATALAMTWPGQFGRILGVFAPKRFTSALLSTQTAAAPANTRGHSTLSVDEMLAIAHTVYPTQNCLLCVFEGGKQITRVRFFFGSVGDDSPPAVVAVDALTGSPKLLRPLVTDYPGLRKVTNIWIPAIHGGKFWGELGPWVVTIAGIFAAVAVILQGAGWRQRWREAADSKQSE